MSCSCKHSREEILQGRNTINAFKDLFIKRLTIDSEHDDRRRKDYNQALFHYKDDDNPELGTYQVWSEITLDMVMDAFDSALKDWRKTFCDVGNCREKY